MPLYAVEKLAKLFFPLSPSVCTFSLSSSSASTHSCSPREMPESERRAGWFSSNVGPRPGVVGSTRRDGRGRSENGERRVRLHRAFPFPRYPSIPRRTSFVTQSKLSPGVVIKSLSAGYLDISRSGKMFRVRVIVRGYPTVYPAC